MVTTSEKRQSASRVRTYLPIEDYGIIGDLHTVALVGKNGSIDWYCVPAFDAPSVFGALLDAEKGGYFQIKPHETPVESHKQHYLPDTNILVTRFLTESGVGEVTDFMPIQQATYPTDRHGIVRPVHVVNGSLSFEIRCRPAFNHARGAATRATAAQWCSARRWRCSCSPTRPPAQWWRRPLPACPRGSAGSATGITASPGFVMPA